MIIHKCKFLFFLVNFITFLRMILSVYFSLTIILIDVNFFEVIILFLLICFTDFIDGKLARFFKVESRFGAVFDVFADFLFVFLSNCVLCYKNLIPFWLLMLILYKIFEFFVTSNLINYFKANSNFFVFDFFGKTLAILLYILPIFVVFIDIFGVYKINFLKNLYIYIVLIFSIFSSIFRIKCLCNFNNLRSFKFFNF